MSIPPPHPRAARPPKTSRHCLLLLAAALACQRPQPATPPSAAPSAPPPPPPDPARVVPAPPPPAAPPEPNWVFPAIERQRLRNGLQIHSVQHRDAPLLELRLMIHSGSRSDGKRPGLAALATQFLKVGGAGSRDARKLLAWLEGLGAQLELTTTVDSTLLSLRVPPEQLRPALRVLADLALRPRFDEPAFQRLRPQQARGRAQRMQGNAHWAASTVAQRELLGPAATRIAPRSSLRLTHADCKGWHRRHFSPRNASLLVVGSFERGALLGAVKAAFERWRGRAVRAPKLPPPPLPQPARVYLVARPASAHSEIQIATLGPERGEDQWLPTQVVVQALGGGRTSRLWKDLREDRALAFDTNCDSAPGVTQGPVPLVLRAATSVDKTGEALTTLLAHYARLGADGLEPKEVESAQRFLRRNLPLRAETAQHILEHVTFAARVGLPADYYSTYSKKIENLDVSEVNAAAAQYFNRPPVVVIAGDVDRLRQPLSRFGELHVLSPKRGLAVDHVESAVLLEPNAPNSGAPDEPPLTPPSTP